ncbi:hypothetical protein PUN28_004690 [Cardiocondyla obscurior]|uniref:Uncharacterized protein n=1 Tax=Cardiocondyla obscurior TaxID=286306 RepID=A0AAW2GC46_9HYME
MHRATVNSGHVVSRRHTHHVSSTLVRKIDGGFTSRLARLLTPSSLIALGNSSASAARVIWLVNSVRSLKDGSSSITFSIQDFNNDRLPGGKPSSITRSMLKRLTCASNSCTCHATWWINWNIDHLRSWTFFVARTTLSQSLQKMVNKIFSLQETNLHVNFISHKNQSACYCVNLGSKVFASRIYV